MKKFKVTEKAMRPASPLERCFYCGRSVGDYHKEDCVLISKKIKIKVEIELEDEMPAHWDKNDYYFSKNESSWCQSNVITMIEELASKNNGCLCGRVEINHISDESEPFLEE